MLPESLVRDNVADCANNLDLCYDENFRLITHRCFRCLDGSHTLALNQVRQNNCSFDNLKF